MNCSIKSLTYFFLWCYVFNGDFGVKVFAQETISASDDSQLSVRDRLNTSINSDGSLPDGEFILFPEFSGERLDKPGKNQTFTSKRGFMSAVFFVSSWCPECQEILPEIKKTILKYEPLGFNAQIVYAYDKPSEAYGSSKEFGVTPYSLIANSKIISQFHSPEIPAVYFSDRNTFLAGRITKLNSTKLADLQDKIRIWLGF